MKNILIRLQKHILNDLHVVIVGEPRRYSVADPGEGRPGTPPPPAPPYFETKLRPEGPKKYFLETGPPLSEGLDLPLIS